MLSNKREKNRKRTSKKHKKNISSASPNAAACGNNAIDGIVYLLHPTRKHVYQYIRNGGTETNKFFINDWCTATECRILLSLLIIVGYFKQTINYSQYGIRYNWSAEEQSSLLGAYFWGYLITQIPGGILSEWFGARHVIGLSTGFSAIATLLTPASAQLSFWAVFLMRMLTGALGVW